MSDKPVTSPNISFKEGLKHPPTDPEDSGPEHRLKAQKLRVQKKNSNISQLSNDGYDDFPREAYWTIPNGCTVQGKSYIDVVAQLYRPYASTTSKINFYNRYDNVNLSIGFDGTTDSMALRTWDSSHGWHSASNYYLGDFIKTTDKFHLYVSVYEENHQQLKIEIVQNGVNAHEYYTLPDGSWTPISYVHYAATKDEELFGPTCQIKYVSE